MIETVFCHSVPFEVISVLWSELRENCYMDCICGTKMPHGCSHTYVMAAAYLRARPELLQRPDVRTAFAKAATASCEEIDKQIASLNSQKEALRSMYIDGEAFG